jgi:putative peptidoglycan lipid II flippase
VRVFYALDDGDTPFKISIVNIFLNALFDYLLLPIGVPGLVLATVSVNILSVLALLYCLNRKLNGLPWVEWSLPILGLTIGSGLAGLAASGLLNLSEQWLGTKGWLIHLVQLAIAGAGGLLIFALFATQLKLPEVNLFVNRIRQKLSKAK